MAHFTLELVHQRQKIKLNPRHRPLVRADRTGLDHCAKSAALSRKARPMSHCALVQETERDKQLPGVLASNSPGRARELLWARRRRSSILKVRATRTLSPGCFRFAPSASMGEREKTRSLLVNDTWGGSQANFRRLSHRSPKSIPGVDEAINVEVDGSGTATASWPRISPPGNTLVWMFA